MAEEKTTNPEESKNVDAPAKPESDVKTEKKTAVKTDGKAVKVEDKTAKTSVKTDDKSVKTDGGSGNNDRRDNNRGGRRVFRKGGGRNDKRGRRREREPREFDQKILDLSRVTRVTTGGKRMRFRVALVIGDRKGRVGFGVAKGTDVQIAIGKALLQAKKNVITLDLVDGSFPHLQEGKFGSAQVMIKPAPKGAGLKCGGAVRDILELGGVTDAVSKILRSKNKANIAKATFVALSKMVVPEGMETDGQKIAKARKEKRDSQKKVVKKTTKKVEKK